MVICPDDLLIDYATGTYAWSADAAYAAWLRSAARFTSALADADMDRLVLVVGLPGAGKTTWIAANPQAPNVLVLDAAAMCRRAERKWFIQQALNAGWLVEAIMLDVPFDVCVARNAARPDGRRVPDDNMQRWRRALQGAPPALDEGFVSITVLKGLGPGGI